MRAAVVRTPGGPFEIVDNVRHRSPGTDEVVVRIHAAGVCHTDLAQAAGGFGQRLPAVLGHEGAGIVSEIGAGVTDVQVGDRVVLSWVPACGRCAMCVRGEPYLCLRRPRAAEQGAALEADGEQIVAGMGTATFAEETVVPARSVISIPDDVPFAIAAVLGCAVPTGFGAAVNTARVGVGETVLVIGGGAVGLNAVQGARIAGAGAVLVSEPSTGRRALALDLGAAAAAAPGDDTETLVRAQTDGLGADVVIDAVGSARTIRTAWDAARRGGRVVVVGAGSTDDLVSFSAQELFHDQKSLTGSFYGSSDMRRDIPRLVAFWRSGALCLDAFTETVVDLDGLDAAAGRQRAGEVLRVVVTP